jgi:hypothetical protein
MSPTLARHALTATILVAAVAVWLTFGRRSSPPALVPHTFLTPPEVLEVPETPDGMPAKQVSFTWQQPQYEKLPPATKVEELIAEGKGFLLESRLGPQSRARVQERLQATTMALRQLAVTYEKEVTRIKGLLVGDPARTITIQAKKREEDPNYPRLLDARARIERGLGGVWGDYVNGQEIHFIVRWDEWPTLKSIRDLQLRLIQERNQAVAQVVEAEYASAGAAIFAAK